MDLVYLVGLLTVGCFAYRFLNWVYVIFLRPGKDLKKIGQYAVVTGATSGIGEAYAMELAKKGLDLVIVGRNQEKMNRVQKEIVESTGRVVKTCQVDFSKFDEAAKERVCDTCKDLDVGILVNNAGLSYNFPEYFEKVDLERLENIVKVNNLAMVQMTHLLLPQMKEANKGAIVNVSSVGGSLPHTLMVVYGSSKAFVDNFSTNLQEELARSGSKVVVSCQKPMFVVSAMSKIRKPTIDKPTAETYCQAGLKQIGYPGVTSPYWVHAIMYGVLGSLPWSATFGYVDGMHKGIRKKAYKKYGLGKYAKKN